MKSRAPRPFGGLIRLVLAVVLLAVLVVGAANLPGMVGNTVGNLLSSLNPFSEKTVDRTGPSVLQSLTRMSDYHAASAHYETVIDLEKDSSILPDWFSGERVLYVAKGDVDALVNFSELDERRVALSDDGTTVTVKLPAPTVGTPVLDLKNSYVASHDEGFTNRFRGSDLERQAQLKALKQMTTAATGEGKLTGLAKENTTAMLRGLLGSLGYTKITVRFDK